MLPCAVIIPLTVECNALGEDHHEKIGARQSELPNRHTHHHLSSAVAQIVPMAGKGSFTSPQILQHGALRLVNPITRFSHVEAISFLVYPNLENYHFLFQQI